MSVVYDGCISTFYLDTGYSQPHNPSYAQTELLKKTQMGCCYILNIHFRQFDWQFVHNIGNYFIWSFSSRYCNV